MRGICLNCEDEVAHWEWSCPEKEVSMDRLCTYCGETTVWPKGQYHGCPQSHQAEAYLNALVTDIARVKTGDPLLIDLDGRDEAQREEYRDTIRASIRARGGKLKEDHNP